ncbi:MAG: dephospho-CoA kinase [Firmicutes bacterium]|nr:dephospho-CoA kinase [Bacillota bacterium]
MVEYSRPEDKYLVVITGGIATGKSMITAFFRQNGQTVVDTDEIARQVVEPGSPVLAKIVGEWGPEILLPDGNLDRKKLGSVIFSSEKDRKKLNSMMHPAIRKVMYKQAAESPNRIVFLDVPLLYEAKVPLPHDEVILVYCPRSIQKERLIIRDSVSAEDAEKRLSSQIDIEEKKNMSKIIIDNSGTPEQAQEQALKVLEILNQREDA